jgi:hypothetical protein
MISIPSKSEALGILTNLMPKAVDGVLREYRSTATRPYWPHSWIQATAYIAAGGTQLMKPGVFDLKSTEGEPAGTSQPELPL